MLIAFVRRYLPFYPKEPVLLPVAVMVLFPGSLVLKAVLFFEYGVGVESSSLRTLVIRPIFYLGFIGLSAYFLYPPQVIEEKAELPEFMLK